MKEDIFRGDLTELFDIAAASAQKTLTCEEQVTSLSYSYRERIYQVQVLAQKTRILVSKRQGKEKDVWQNRIERGKQMMKIRSGGKL